MSLLAAITHHDVARFLSNFVIVYVVLIFLEILMSWIPRRPYYTWLEAVVKFIHETTDPYLRLFRSFIKPIGGGQFAFDPSPMIAVLVLIIGSGIIIGAIDRA